MRAEPGKPVEVLVTVLEAAATEVLSKTENQLKAKIDRIKRAIDVLRKNFNLLIIYFNSLIHVSGNRHPSAIQAGRLGSGIADFRLEIHIGHDAVRIGCGGIGTDSYRGLSAESPIKIAGKSSVGVSAAGIEAEFAGIGVR